jgi:hypothetical protein
MRCFSSSVVPLQPPQPCVSFHEIWRREMYNTIKSPQTRSIALMMATTACLAVPLRLTIKPSKSLPYIKSISHLSSFIAAHHTLGTARCNLQKYILLPSKGASHLWTKAVFKTSCHASHQATIPAAQQHRQLSCHAYHYFPISDAKDFHASCLNIGKHSCSVAALPRASGPLVALLPRSPSGI